ncbi:MAG: SPFH domain-containing protein [Deltaproteobacteria bacterium]|uniref:SPFH domain-containing protein n=1 Tax=Candidatus Zymogenus saltonus TaxID=2844893 RepID=A0A9D8KDQ8_9DELT|nr:SPFH domain-containing protein [Candidatus Zymogenus saltonus]
MFGIHYFKAEPTEFVRIRIGRRVKKEGEGISGYYLPYRTTVEMVSVAAIDQPFYFKEFSKDNQEVDIQGGFIFRVSSPKRVIETYNFSVDPTTKEYLTEDSMKLPEHILQLIKGKTRNIVQETPLAKLLLMGDKLAKDIIEGLGREEIFSDMGIDLRSLYFASIRPTPEIAKALEAEYREQLLQKADEAIYARRAQAVENERVIQQNEMKTKIELELKRKELVELEGKNIIQNAEYRAQAKERELKVYDKLGADKITAQALLAIGENAEKIGNLTITPDLLAQLLKK